MDINTTLEAVLVIEETGARESPLTDKLTAWQYIIDRGATERLQGSYRAIAISLVEHGLCRPPIPPVRVIQAAETLERLYGLRGAITELRWLERTGTTDLTPFTRQVLELLVSRRHAPPLS